MGEKISIFSQAPQEDYRKILEMVGKKMETEEDWDKGKKIVTTIICKANPDINEEEFFKSLTKQSTIKFIDPYAEFLFKASGSKNLKSPLKKEEKK